MRCERGELMEKLCVHGLPISFICESCGVQKPPYEKVTNDRLSGVTKLDDHRPHLAGQAACGGCGYQWTSIIMALSETPMLECPQCSQMLGIISENEEND
jgi:hypothetical protein